MCLAPTAPHPKKKKFAPSSKKVEIQVMQKGSIAHQNNLVGIDISIASLLITKSITTNPLSQSNQGEEMDKIQKMNNQSYNSDYQA